MKIGVQWRSKNVGGVQGSGCWPLGIRRVNMRQFGAGEGTKPKIHYFLGQNDPPYFFECSGKAYRLSRVHSK